MTQANRKSSSLNETERTERRLVIENKRGSMRNLHMKRGRYYVKYLTTTFSKRQSGRQNARYAALPDGAMHNLPLGHVVNSNDHKRAVAALAPQISSEKVAIEKKTARKPRVTSAA